MVVIETVDSVFAMPDGIAKVCVRERDEATNKLIAVNLLDNDATGRFLVLISQRVPTTANTAGFIPLWSFVVGTRKRASADKIFAEISRAVFLPDIAGTVVWLDIRDVLADDVREVPAERQSGVGKGRAIDIDGTGIAAVPAATTKAAEVNVTRRRAPAESTTRGWNIGGWAGNGAEWWAPAQQRGEASAGATFNINNAAENWPVSSAELATEIRAAVSQQVQNVPYSTADVQQLGRAGNTPDNSRDASL